MNNNEKSSSVDPSATDYRKLIEKDGVIAQLTVGMSMHPMLVQRRDTVIIKKITSPLKENDVVLYQKKSGKYILHRIIKVKGNEYIIRGDNCFFNEKGITDDTIIGVLEGFYKKDKYVDCNKSVGYKIYIQLNRRTYYIRKAIFKTRLFLSKIKHKLFK